MEIYFWVDGDNENTTSIATVSSNARVTVLKDAIKEKRQIGLRHVDASELTLYAIPMPAEDHRKEELQMERISRVGRLLKDLEVLSSLNLTDSSLVVVSPGKSSGITTHGQLVGILCWIQGHKPAWVFEVQILQTAIVTKLKGAIKDKDLPGLEHVKSVELNLYAIPLPPPENLENFLRSELALNKEHLLGPTDPISRLNIPHTLVIAVPPRKSEGVPTYKHLPTWDVDILARASKGLKYAPSDLDPSRFFKLQQDVDDRFMNTRPIKVSGHEGESQSDLGSSWMDAILEAGTRLCKVLPTSYSIDEAICIIQGVDVPCAFIKFKNEEASKSIPAVQLASYYRRGVSKMKQELILYSRLPALGITIVGPTVTFYTLLWVGSVFYLPLTPGISCLPLATGGNDRHALHRAFIAANKLICQIGVDTKALLNTISSSASIPPYCHLYPDLTELPSFHNPNTSIHFQIVDILHHGQGRILYLAQSTSTPTKPDLVIKVTRSYSTALHEHCASHGCAPTLREFAVFPGRVVVVAMDYLEGEVLAPKGSQELRNNLAEQLKRLVQGFHNIGYVHGDLRPPNIYVVGNQVKLLDFDWGGRVGEALYPAQILHRALTEGRDMNDLRIGKEDDNRVLKRTLEHIGCL